MKFWQQLTLGGLVYLLVCVVLFPTVLTGKETFFFADNYSLMVPQKLFLIQQLKQGVFPFWNPFIHSGTPTFADTSFAVFYPTTLAFWLLPVNAAINITVIAHYILAALGAFTAARLLKQSFLFALISGGIWMLSETMLTISSNFTILQSTAWVSWLLAIHIKSFSKPSWLIFQPLVVALAFLGGHPQLLAYYLFAFTLYVFVARRSFKYLFRYILSLVAVIPLLLFILVPFFELGGLSTRNLSSWSEKMAGSLHPAVLVHWFVPHVFSDPASGMVWGPEWDHIRMIAGYATLSLLFGYALFVSKKEKTEFEKFLTVLALGSLVFALGKYVPVFWKIIEYIPGINSFRNPAAAIGLWSLAVSVLAGQSLNALTTFAKKHQFLVPVSVILVAGLLAGRVGVNFFTPDMWLRLHLSGFHTYERDVQILQTISGSALMVLIGFTLVLIFLRKGKRFLPLVLCVIVADLALAHRSIVHLAPYSVYDQASPQAAWLQKNAQPGYRALSSSSYLAYTGFSDYWNNIFIRPPFGESRFGGTETQTFSELKARQFNLGADWNMVYNQPLVNGYATFVLKDTADYWEHDPKYTPINDIDKVPFDDNRLNEQGVKYITVDKTIFDDKKTPFELKGFPIIEDHEDWAILENPHALPIIRYKSPDSGLITIGESTVNEIKFTVNTTQDDDVIIAVAHYPGWKCEVDGKPCLLETEGLGMKVQTEPGNHTFRLWFIPTGWPVLGIISLLSWLFYGGYLVKISKNE